MYPDNLFWNVNLYNICLTIGLLCVIFVLDKYLEKRKVPAKVENFYLIVGVLTIGLGILSANLFQSVYHYIETGVFTFDAGMTFYGGLIGGVIGFFFRFFVFGKDYFQRKRTFQILFGLGGCRAVLYNHRSRFRQTRLSVCGMLLREGDARLSGA